MDAEHTEKSPLARYRRLLIIALPLVMIFFSYCNTFYSPLYLDDFHSFVEEPLLKAGALSLDQLRQAGQTKFGLKRWVPMVTFSWDIAVGKGRLLSFHLTNLIIHMCCFVSVLFLWLMLLRQQEHRTALTNCALPPFDIALWSAVLWALHPVQTNAVTYLVQRMASLATLFSVLCVAFYVAGRVRLQRCGRLDLKTGMLFSGSALGLLLSLFCKENSLMNPVLLVLTETWFFRPDTPQRILRFVRRHLMVSLGACVIVLLTMVHIFPDLLANYQNRHFTIIQRLLTECRIIVWYGSLLFWPAPGRLSMEHDVVISTSLFQPITTIVSIAFLIVMAALVVVKRKEYPLLTYGVLWFLLNLAIESSIVPLELVFEHRLYLPSVGLALTVVILIYVSIRRLFIHDSKNDYRKLSWSVIAILASVLSLLTFQRNEAWRDAVTLNRDNVAKAPGSARAHANLAVALSRSGQYEEAIKEGYSSIALGRHNLDAYTEAANAIILSCYHSGDYQRTVEVGESLIAEHSAESGALALPYMCLSTSVAYRDMGDYPSAYRLILKALWFNQHLTWRMPPVGSRIASTLLDLLTRTAGLDVDLNGDGLPDPGGVSPSSWVAKVMIQHDHPMEAEVLLRMALQENPEDQEAQRLLEAMKDDSERSRIQGLQWSFWKKYVRQPFSRFNLYMAIAYLIQSKHLPEVFFGIGDRCLDSALKLNPKSADVHLLRGWYHYQRDDMTRALDEAGQALELDPDYAKGWLGLGFFLLKADRPQEALVAFNKTLRLYPYCPDGLAIRDIMAGLHAKLAGTSPPSASP